MYPANGIISVVQTLRGILTHLVIIRLSSSMRVLIPTTPLEYVNLAQLSRVLVQWLSHFLGLFPSSAWNQRKVFFRITGSVLIIKVTLLLPKGSPKRERMAEIRMEGRTEGLQWWWWWMEGMPREDNNNIVTIIRVVVLGLGRCCRAKEG